MKGYLFGLTALAVLGITGTANAEKLSYKQYHWASYGGKVQSHTDVHVFKTGRVHVKTVFSNGEKIYPAHPHILVVLKDKKGKVLWGCKMGIAGLGPSWWGSANECTRSCSGNIGPLAKDVATSGYIAKPYGPELVALSNKLLQEFIKPDRVAGSW